MAPRFLARGSMWVAAVFAACLSTVQPAGTRAPAALPNDPATIVHVLNRAGFGPRAGDVDRVQRMGLAAYIEEQLHPERIPDAAVAARLENLKTIGLTSREITERFEQPLLAERRQARMDAGQTAGAAQEPAAPPPTPTPTPTPTQQQANVAVVELSQQKLVRAIYSDRQLQEVLTDFWFNHFNVDARKGRTRFLLTEYEREAIRPHVLGKFRDLLEATAKSPAMLFYLDNWMSVDPKGLHLDNAPRALARPRVFGRGRFPNVPAPRAQAPARVPPNMPRGLNENYGRELMELHTLGVDAGYTQKDVTEVARAFTGWTIERPQQGGAAFRFEPRMHDEGEKVVLGHRLKAGRGIEDGEAVLDSLAKHPATARFIAGKLARRFVGDAPPPALVDRLAVRFRDTDGDLREVMRALLTSPEFLSADARGAKVKTPFEFIVSSVRTVGVEVPDGRLLVRAAQQLGMPLYQCQPPTGYKDTADAWANSGALVARMNFALALGRYAAPGDEESFVARALGPDVPSTTRATIARATEPAQIVALTLGSPEFQRH